MLRIITSYAPQSLSTRVGPDLVVRFPALVENEEDGTRWLLIDGSAGAPYSLSTTWWRRAQQDGAAGLLITDGWRFEAAVSHHLDEHGREGADGRFHIWDTPLALFHADESPTYHEVLDQLEAKQDPPQADAGFVHLHTHSEFSALDGLSRMDEIVREVVRHGQTAVAITDHGTVAGHPELQRAADKAGVKPIFGIEAYLCDDRVIRAEPGDKELQASLRNDYWHVCLFAMDDTGLRNVWAASTESFRDGFYHRPRMDWDTLGRFSEGVIASTGCLRGPVAVAIKNGDADLARQRLTRLMDLFPGRLYVELQPNDMPDQVKLNQTLVALAREFKLPLLATVDSHFPTADDAHAHDVWIACQTNKDVQDEGDLFAEDLNLYVMGEAEVRAGLAYLGPDVVEEAIVNTRALAERCNARIEGETTTPSFTGDPAEDERRLHELCMANWSRLPADQPGASETYRDRYRREMDLLVNKGFCGYYLMVSDYVRWAKDHGILVGPGRGSGGGSLVAYLARITSLDPIKHDLLFERFLTMGRAGLPDFDVDFPASKKAEILGYLRERWGERNVVSIGSELRLKNKAVINELVRALASSLPEDAAADLRQVSTLIDEAEAGTAGLGMCLSNRSRVVLSDGTTRYIGDIVRKRDSVEVLSVDSEGHVRPAKVVNWYRNPRNSRKMLRISYATAPKLRHIYATEDHPVMTQRGWVPAGELREDDLIATGQVAPSPRQMDLIVGTMLGDAGLARRRAGASRLQMSHGVQQEEWLCWKAERLQGLGMSVKKLAQSGKSFGKERFDARSASLASLDQLRDEFYPSGTKIVPRDRFMAMGPLGMAAWYLDDGSMHRETRAPNGQPSGKIAICSFSMDDARWIVSMLNFWGFDCKLDSFDYPRVRFTTTGFKKFCDYIGPYVPPFMRYKLRDDAPAYDPNLCETGEPVVFYDRVVVEEDDRKPDPERGDDWVYDIEVEGNHNFVTIGGVVHNSWEDLWVQHGEQLQPFADRYPELFAMAERLVGRLKSYGRHAAGVVISTGAPLTDWLPMRTIDGEEQMVTQWAMGDVEAIGLVKFDILTLRTLDTIQETLDLVREQRRYEIDLEAWEAEFEDPLVWDELQAAHTLGVFQIETHSGTRLCERMRPRNVAELADMVTIVRPGPMNSGLTDLYLRRRAGEQAVSYPDERLQRVLEPTYGCFAAETRVITKDGVREIGELAGAHHDLMTTGGIWTHAEVRSFGVQPLMKVTLRRNKQTKVIYATPEHRWFGRWSDNKSKIKELLTTELQSGMVLAAQLPHSNLNRSTPSPFGIAAGIVFGDGTRNQWQSSVRLYGEKDVQLLKYFPNSRTSSYAPTGGPDAVPYIQVLDLPRSWREYPRLDEGTSYLYGWLAGYFAADGQVTAKGAPLITSAKREDLEFFRTVGHLVGIGTYAITEKHVTLQSPGSSAPRDVTFYDMGLVSSTLPDDFFLIGEHRRRFVEARAVRVKNDRVQWTVTSVEETDRVEEVFCAVVPETHAFVLEDNILTGNCMIYQEQVMAVTQLLAGYDESEADYVRRILGKKKVSAIAEAGQTFLDRVDMPREQAERLWAQMAEFSKYGFNKSHAYAYAFLAFWTAFLKVNYPREFLVAAMSTVDKDRVPEFVKEARRLDVEVLPPDINHSGPGFTADPDQYAVRYGLGSVKGVGDVAVRALVEAQPYASWEDFETRRSPKANAGVTALLARVGAFDSLVANRRGLEAKLLAAKTGEDAQCVHKRVETVPGALQIQNVWCTFDWSSEPAPINPRTGKILKRKPLPKRCTKACRQYTAPPPLQIENVDPYTPIDIRAIEHEMLGTYLSSTPFDDLSEKDRAVCRAQAEQLATGPNGTYYVAAIVAGARPHTARSGDQMGFLNLETEVSTIRVAVYRDTWAIEQRRFTKGALCLAELKKTDRGCSLVTYQPL